MSDDIYLRRVDDAIREAIVEAEIPFQEVQRTVNRAIAEHERHRRSLCPDCEGTLLDHDEECQHITALHGEGCLCAPCRSATYGVTHH